MLPGPAAHAGLCGVMAGRTEMTLLCSALMGRGPVPLVWGHYVRTEQVPDEGFLSHFLLFLQLCVPS